MAPFDGQVINWQVREGIQVARYRGTAVGTVQSFDDNPVLAVYPDGYWYGNVTEDSLEEILDALEEDRPCEEHLIALSSN